MKLFKACACYFHQICIFSPNDNPSKYSRSKVLFDLEKIATETFMLFSYNIDEM